jgi:hypothetical protein
VYQRSWTGPPAERTRPCPSSGGGSARNSRLGLCRWCSTGKPIAEVACDLGINEGTLGNWMNGNWMNIWRRENPGHRCAIDGDRQWSRRR